MTFEAVLAIALGAVVLLLLLVKQGRSPAGALRLRVKDAPCSNATSGDVQQPIPPTSVTAHAGAPPDDIATPETVRRRIFESPSAASTARRLGGGGSAYREGSSGMGFSGGRGDDEVAVVERRARRASALAAVVADLAPDATPEQAAALRQLVKMRVSDLAIDDREFEASKAIILGTAYVERGRCCFSGCPCAAYMPRTAEPEARCSVCKHGAVQHRRVH
jgi:hypothetical protein